jgi:hypothetical protein
VKRGLFLTLLVVCLAALPACAGSVLGGQAKCSGSVALITQVSGECERTIDSLTDAQTERIAVQTVDVVPHATVDYAVTVDRGRVRISFVDSSGDTEAAEASPGDPVSGSVRVQLNPLNQISFELEPVGGEASGVEYHISFVCDCMP